MRNVNDLARFFIENMIQDFIFIPNPGNAGDALINASTFQFFDALGLNYTVINPKKVKRSLSKKGALVDLFDFKDKTVVLGGGGAFTSHYSYSNRLVDELHADVKKLILLPCTIEGNQEVLRKLGENVVLFCRELVSFEYVSKQCDGPNIYLHDDMVLGVNIYDLMQFKASSSIRKKFKCFRSHFRVEKYVKNHGVNKLNAFRLDKEKTKGSIPKGNMDMSTLFSLGTQTKEENYYSAQQFLKHLNLFERIATNRLHVCIASVLLGKEVEFHSNSYYKNRAVFDQSLKSFPNISFVISD